MKYELWAELTLPHHRTGRTGWHRMSSYPDLETADMVVELSRVANQEMTYEVREAP